MTRTTLLASFLCLLGCTPDLAAAGQAYFAASESSSTNADDDDDVSSTTGNEPIATVTSAAPDGADSTSEEADPGGPKILSFTATPGEVPEAGPVTVTIEHTPDVVEVMLFDEYDGSTEHLVDLAPGEPWTFPITSEADFEGTHELHAIVADDEGRWDEATTVVNVDVPPAGSPVWVNEGQDDDEPYFKIGIAAVAIDDAVIVAGRDLNAGAGYSFVRRYAGESGDIEWTSVLGEDVRVHGIAAAENGVVAVGSILKNGTRRAWVHMFDNDGMPIWNTPQIWLDHSEATAVAVAENGDIYVAGDLTVEDGIEHTDVFVWHLHANAMPTWATWDSNETLTPYDHASAIIVDSDGQVFVGGNSTFDIPNNLERPRMAVLKYSDAELELRWGDRVVDSSDSGLYGLSGIDNDVAVAGWRRTSPGDPLMLEVSRLQGGDGDDQLSPIWTYTDAGSEDRLAVGLSINPNGRLAAVGTITGNHDALEVLVLDPSGSLSWSANYQYLAGGNANAGAVTVDRFGYVYFVGTLAVDGGFRTLVGKRHP